MGKGGQRSATIQPKAPQAVDEKPNHWVSPYNPKDPNVQLPKVSDIKAAIPKHCFERSYVKSIYYTLRDTAWAVGFVYATTKVMSTEMPSEPAAVAAWVLGWNLYAFGMGTIMFGPWILGHECGHGAFSPNQTFNDIFGFVLHHQRFRHFDLRSEPITIGTRAVGTVE